MCNVQKAKTVQPCCELTNGYNLLFFSDVFLWFVQWISSVWSTTVLYKAVRWCTRIKNVRCSFTIHPPSPWSLGWRDIDIFAIFENGHYADEQDYFDESDLM